MKLIMLVVSFLFAVLLAIVMENIQSNNGNNKPFRVYDWEIAQAGWTLEKESEYDRNIVSLPVQEQLYVACRRGDVEHIYQLLMKGALISQPEEHGFTPLYFATRLAHPQAVEYLISQGASLNNAYGRHKNNILAVAVLSKNPQTVKALIDQAAIVLQQKHQDIEVVLNRKETTATWLSVLPMDIMTLIKKYYYGIGLCDLLTDRNAEGKTALELADKNPYEVLPDGDMAIIKRIPEIIKNAIIRYCSAGVNS